MNNEEVELVVTYIGEGEVTIGKFTRPDAGAFLNKIYKKFMLGQVGVAPVGIEDESGSSFEAVVKINFTYFLSARIKEIKK